MWGCFPKGVSFLMPSRNFPNMMPLCDSWRKKSPVGSGGLGVLFAGVLVCLWLTMTSPGLVRALFSNTPLLTIPLPDVNGLVHAQPLYPCLTLKHTRTTHLSSTR